MRNHLGSADLRQARREVRIASARVATMYAVYAAAWVIFSDLVLEQLGLAPDFERVIASTKGVLFVLVTALALYVGTLVHLTRLRSAQTELYGQEVRIRRAYVDVLSAVTGGRLVLVMEEELNTLLGDQVMGPVGFDTAASLGGARRQIREAVASVDEVIAGSMNLPSAVGEALTNALKHAGRGTYGVCSTDMMVQVRIDDDGPGIDFKTLPKATLMSGFSTTSTMGLGFTLMLQLCERVLLFTRPGHTTVVLEFARDQVPTELLGSHGAGVESTLTAAV